MTDKPIDIDALLSQIPAAKAQIQAEIDALQKQIDEKKEKLVRLEALDGTWKKKGKGGRPPGAKNKATTSKAS